MQNEKKFYGATYDSDQDKVLIYIGVMQKLIKKGIELQNIMDDRAKARVTGLNLRYKYLRKLAKESSNVAAAIDSLNQQIKHEAQNGKVNEIIEYTEI